MKEILTEAAPTAQFEGPFGIKTKFAEEPLTDIIQARYTNFATEDQGTTPRITNGVLCLWLHSFVL